MWETLLDRSKANNPFKIDFRASEYGEPDQLVIVFRCPTQNEPKWEGFELMGQALKDVVNQLSERLNKPIDKE